MEKMKVCPDCKINMKPSEPAYPRFTTCYICDKCGMTWDRYNGFVISKKLEKKLIYEKYNYKPRCRGHPDLPETEELNSGFRFRRECICCKKFSQTNEQYEKEIGNCAILGIVSEWGICDEWKLNDNNEKELKI